MKKQKMYTKDKDIIDKKSINYSFNSFYIKYQISHPHYCFNGHII